MVEIRVSATGQPTALIDGRHLHSPRDPVREASRTVREICRREPPCVVLMGLGLGYAAEALLAGTGTTRLIIFEPAGETTRILREARDPGHALTSPRVAHCDTIQAFAAALVDHAAQGFEVLTLPARRLADPDAFLDAERALASFRNRVEINTNTLLRFGRVWVRNLCRNMPVLASGRSVAILKNTFAGLPGVLLAAGPTLDQILPHLPAIAEHAVVVAVDTAVIAVLRSGVQPDIAVVVDPQYWNARHLDQVCPSETLLVAESSTHPSVFRHFREPSLFCGSLFPLGQALESALGPVGRLGAGGSVSTTAWDLLRYLGCEPIYTAGLDLGFPLGRTHCRGSFFETLAIAQATRMRPAEMTLHRYVRSAGPFPVDANDGGQVLTDRRMELYRNWFTRKLAAPESPPTFSISLGGARVDGMETASVSDLLSRGVIRPAVTACIDRVRSDSHATRHQRMSEIVRKLSEIRTALENLENLARRALGHLAGLSDAFAAGDSVDFAPLARIDEEIQNSPGQALVSFLMQEAISHVTAGFGAASMAEQLEASREIYHALLDSVTFHLSAISQVRRDLDSGPARKSSS